nr:phosphopentomutase [Clostridiales bacterium]
VSEKPMPVFPDGFPEKIIREFSEKTKRGVLCNKPYSGTDVIRDYGEEHMKTGSLIVYTSADSVFQIAAHEDVVPLEELYEDCRIARKILKDECAVGRVIARPFIGEPGSFTRTSNRHDFSLEAPSETLLDAMIKNGKYVYSVGKIHDIFAGRGMSDYIFTTGNADGMQKTLEAADMDFEGLCFTNLVDFDMLYGHRQDIDGYANAFAEFDMWLSDFIPELKEDDILMITADHGCDPGDESTDHSREYIPLLVYGKKVKPLNLGTRACFCDIAASITKYFDIDFDCPGKEFLTDILDGE